MINAMVELSEHVNNKDVEFIKLVYGCNRIEGSLNEVMPKLDFDYDGGYGCQELFGYIWYGDGTWSQRGEYDGLEWWEHMERPSKEGLIW
jgi:hypothetical protein